MFGCGECPRVSSVSARGWKAYWVADPDEGWPAALLFLCPDCARTELADDSKSRNPSIEAAEAVSDRGTPR